MYRRFRQEQANLYSPEQVKRVINGSGINIESEVDSDYLIFCPYHNNFRTPAGEVEKETGHFFCFSCQESRGFVEFIMHVTRKTYFETVRFIEAHEVETDLISSIDKALAVKVELEPFDELLIKRLHNNAINSPRAIRYYEGRRISMESIVKFQLGYSENYDMVTTPIHSPDGSMYLGFVGRSVEGKEFKNTSGNWRSKTLFNLHRAKVQSTVYVVESNFDAIRLDQNGVPAVATLGAYVSKNQIDLLTKHFNSVILVKDNDNGGDKMSEKMVERLGHRVTAVGIPPRFKDVGDMTDSDIQELTSRATDPLLAMY